MVIPLPVITEITSDMKPHLDNRQLELLSNSLKHRLRPEQDVLNRSNADYLELFLSAKSVEGRSEKSLKYYRLILNQLFAAVKKDIKHITADDLRIYLADYQETRGVSRVTLNNVRRVYSSFFGWLEAEDHILKNPVKRINSIKTRKTIKATLTDEELELCRAACTTLRDIAIIDWLASTGVRVGELVRLNRRDINFHNRECVVLGKGDKERVVYFDARAKLSLQKYLDDRKDNNPALFVTLHKPHERLQIGGISTRVREIGKIAGLQKVHPHKFRRTFATMGIGKGMPIEQMQQLLGHERIDTTTDYAMVDQANVKSSHRKYIG